MDILKKIFPISFRNIKDTTKLVIGILIYILVPILVSIIFTFVTGIIAGISLSLAALISTILWVIDSVLGLYCLTGLVLQLLVHFDVIK